MIQKFWKPQKCIQILNFFKNCSMKCFEKKLIIYTQKKVYYFSETLHEIFFWYPSKISCPLVSTWSPQMKSSLSIFVKLSAMQWMPLIGCPGLLYNIGTEELRRFANKLVSLTTYFSVDISRDPRDVSILLFTSLTSPQLHSRVTSGEILPHLVRGLWHWHIAIVRQDKLWLCNKPWSVQGTGLPC